METIHLAQPLLIRFARLGDAAALHAACFPGQSYDSVVDYLRWCLEGPARPARLIAIRDGQLVAHIEVTPRQNGTWAEISHLVVAEPFRGEGIGHRVVGAAVRLARRLGCNEIRVQLLANEIKRMNKYRDWGFFLHGLPLAGYCWLALPVSLLPISGYLMPPILTYPAPEAVATQVM
ncbi:MAG: GNAT family N-acetyltransferase [Ardenticatenaceae bacterium]